MRETVLARMAPALPASVLISVTPAAYGDQEFRFNPAFGGIKVGFLKLGGWFGLFLKPF